MRPKRCPYCGGFRTIISLFCVGNYECRCPECNVEYTVREYIEEQHDGALPKAQAEVVIKTPNEFAEGLWCCECGVGFEKSCGRRVLCTVCYDASAPQDREEYSRATMPETG